MQVRCSACRQVLRVNAQAQPIQVKCPSCGTLLQIPAASETQSAPATPTGGDRDGGNEDPFGDLPSTAPSLPNPFPAAGSPAASNRPVAPAARPTVPQHNKRFPAWGYVAIAASILVLSPIVCCGVFGLIGLSRMKGTAAVVMSEGLDAIPAPKRFPDLGEPVTRFPSGVQMYRAAIRSPQSGPGSKMELRIYVPAGEHDAGSLPCVLVAPAGTPLLHGAGIDDDDYHDETLPYSEAGMVVVHYSIDGAILDAIDINDEQAYSNAMAKAWPAFKESGGGVVNGRNALEFALAKLESVDPKRICAAGHSSAGTLALMLAATEPRVSHCAAYAPAYDCEKRMADVINDPMTRILLPGVKPFIGWYSPINHVDDFRCKVMIFHSRDDDNVPFADAERFVDEMRTHGKTVEFVKANQGGHYTSMINEGIPAAIEWFGL